MDNLTSKLRESIAYEQSKRLQPFNPSLSDFSEDHLKLAARAFLKERKSLEDHATSLESYPSLAFMMQDKADECREEIKMLDELFVQFAGAIVNKRKETAERN